MKDIENANVLTGGCVFRSLPHYTVHATEQMIRRNVRQNTEPFFNSIGDNRHRAAARKRSKVTLSDHAAYSRRAASYHRRCCIG